jgi:hypothetical protein
MACLIDSDAAFAFCVVAWSVTAARLTGKS